MAGEHLKYFWQDWWGQSPYTVEYLIYDQRLGLLNAPDFKYLTQFLKKSYKICEAGCGMGQYVAYLCSQGYHCYGFDYVFSGLKKCRSECSIDTLCQADLLNMPYKSDVFDLILSLGVLEHFPKENQINTSLREMHRTLKDGGVLIIEVPYRHFLIRLKSLIRSFLSKIPIIRSKLRQQSPFFEHQFTKKGFLKILKQNNWCASKVIFIDQYFGLATLMPFLTNRKKRYSEYEPYVFNLWGRLIFNFTKFIPQFSSHMLLVIAKKYTR